MKSFIPLLAAASLVAAQDYSGQPKCAIPCLNMAIPKVGCSLKDTGCQCSGDKQSQLALIVAPCLVNACDGSDLLKAQAAASAACAAFASTAGSGFISTGSDTSTSESSALISTNHLLPPGLSTRTPTGGPATPSSGTTSGPSTPTSTVALTRTRTEAPTTTAPSSAAGSSAAGSSTTTASSSSSSGGAGDLAARGALLMFAAALAL